MSEFLSQQDVRLTIYTAEQAKKAFPNFFPFDEEEELGEGYYPRQLDGETDFADYVPDYFAVIEFNGHTIFQEIAPWFATK
jgi:hypothetical protein